VIGRSDRSSAQTQPISRVLFHILFRLAGLDLEPADAEQAGTAIGSMLVDTVCDVLVVPCQLLFPPLVRILLLPLDPSCKDGPMGAVHDHEALFLK